MGNLSSIFEIFVALNSAYILSQEFLQALNTKITRILQDIQEPLNQVESLIESNKDYLFKLSSEILERMQKERAQQEIFEVKFKDLNNSVFLEIDKASISPIFSIYCLFAAMYSFSVLLGIGFDSDFHCINDDAFFVFNISNILLFPFFIKLNSEIRYKSKWFFNSGYFCSVIIIIISWTIYICVSVYQNNEHIKFMEYSKFIHCTDYGDCPIDFFTFNKVLSIIIPTAHFITYFGIAIRNKQYLYPKLEKEIRNFEKEIQEFSKEISYVASGISRK